MFSKRLEKEYIQEIASIINEMVEKDERLVGDFTTIINIKKQERKLNAVEFAGVGFSLASITIYVLTKNQLPYLSAFASWMVARAIDDFRVSHSAKDMEYSNFISADILARMSNLVEDNLLSALQSDGKMMVYRTIDYMAGNRKFVKKIENLQQSINAKSQKSVEI